MKTQTVAVDKFSAAAAEIIPLDHSCLPVDYVSDAVILVDLVETLAERGARPR